MTKNNHFETQKCHFWAFLASFKISFSSFQHPNYSIAQISHAFLEKDMNPCVRQKYWQAVVHVLSCVKSPGFVATCRIVRRWKLFLFVPVPVFTSSIYQYVDLRGMWNTAGSLTAGPVAPSEKKLQNIIVSIWNGKITPNRVLGWGQKYKVRAKIGPKRKVPRELYA